MLEYTLIKQHQPRFNVRLRRRQELPVPGRHRVRRVAAARWSCGAPGGRASATSGPTATPTPSARRSTCCCARSRSARARTTSSNATRSWAGRACCSTSRSAPARASSEVEQDEYDDAGGASSSSSSMATPSRSCNRLEAEMREAADELEFEQAARLRDRLTSGSQGHRAPADGRRPRRGRRRHRHRRGRARGVGPGLLRPRGRVVGRKGFVLDKVEDLTPAELVGNVLERLYDEPPPSACRSQVLVPAEPEDPDLYERVAVRGCGGRR